MRNESIRRARQNGQDFSGYIAYKRECQLPKRPSLVSAFRYNLNGCLPSSLQGCHSARWPVAVLPSGRNPCVLAVAQAISLARDTNASLTACAPLPVGMSLALSPGNIQVQLFWNRMFPTYV